MIWGMEENNWYYNENGKPTGPVTLADVQQLFAAGRINGGTLVWHQTLVQWMPAGQVPGVVACGAAADIADGDAAEFSVGIQFCFFANDAVRSSWDGGDGVCAGVGGAVCAVLWDFTGDSGTHTGHCCALGDVAHA